MDNAESITSYNAAQQQVIEVVVQKDMELSYIDGLTATPIKKS